MRKTAIRFGSLMFIGFTGLFLVMHLFGLSQNYNLRILNGVIHFLLIFFAVREYGIREEGKLSNYLNGVAVGMWTSAVGVVGFTIFMIVFLALDQNFMIQLKNNFSMGKYLNPVTAGALILMEGLIVSLIGSYIATRILEARFRNLNE